MLVYFVTDEPTKLPAVRAMLEPQHAVLPWVLGGDGTGIRSHGVLMVDIDLRQGTRVDQLKFVLQDLSDIPEKLFVVHNLSRSLVAQAYALGATAVISRPKDAIQKVAEIEQAETEAEDKDAETPPADEGVAAFASMFSNVRNGRPLKLVDAQQATSKIITRVGQDGLSTWLDEVRRYHEGTFQHCLLVTGIASRSGWTSDSPAATFLGLAWRRPCMTSARRASRSRSWTSRAASIPRKKRSSSAIP